MRPVSNFLIMQLSNSRREPGEYSENVKDTKQNCKMTAGGVCAIMWKKKKDLIFPCFSAFCSQDQVFTNQKIVLY